MRENSQKSSRGSVRFRTQPRMFAGVQSGAWPAARMRGVSSTANNLLLAGLAPASRDALLSQGELVTLSAGQALYDEGERVTHAYFPVDCVVTLAARATATQSLAIGAV